jgi:hypothetical protein
MKELDIIAVVGRRDSAGTFYLKGTNVKGQKFGKEMRLPDEGISLDRLEQFILEVKYEALYPPVFNIQDNIDADHLST